MKKGDRIRAKQQLSIREANDFQMLGILEGIVLKANPLIIEIDVGGDRYQVRIADEAKEKFGVIEEAKDE